MRPAGIAGRASRRAPALASALCLGGLLSACVQAPPAPPVGVVDVASRPAERSLLDGLKAYDDAQYDVAQSRFRQALALGLASPRDRAEAHKRLAFVACAANRIADCETEFREARGADPAFILDRTEAGHPVWGPVYRKVAPTP